MASTAVGKVRGTGETGSLADAHLCYALIPAFDDFALANSELERNATISAGIEFRPVFQSTWMRNKYFIYRLSGEKFEQCQIEAEIIFIVKMKKFNLEWKKNRFFFARRKYSNLLRYRKEASLHLPV